jgi:hypothetical protein
MKTLLSKPYFLIPLVLAGISINGALVIGGLSLVGRLLAPEVPAEVAETKPQPLPVQPTSQGTSPKSSAPDPVTVRLQDGLDLGYKAAVMAKTAQSPEEWARVSLKWTEAIRKLKEIPGSSPEYLAARAKITEYLMNAEIASANGVTQDIAEYGKGLDTAVNTPGAPMNQSVAQSPTQPQQDMYPESSDDSLLEQNLKAQEAFNNMELERIRQLNDERYRHEMSMQPIYSAQALRERLGNMNAHVDERVNIAVLGLETLAYPEPSDSGICDYPWQIDSLGRRCGDRAASQRPGGY